jgi:hypothetical protein
MGAGLLPVAIVNKKLYFLFGKERDRPNETARGWADFGGGHEKRETPIVTAAREGAEEMSGFLGDKYQISKLLRKQKFVIKSDSEHYTTYVVPIEYDKKLPVYFNNQIKFLETYVDSKKLNHTTMYEKEEIKWFSINMLKKDKNKFREFYQEIVAKIIKNDTNIKSLFKKSLKRKVSLKKSMKLRNRSTKKQRQK